MTGADMVVQVLADEGLDTVFGYSGGAILPTYDAVFRYNASHPKEEEIRLVVPATEQRYGANHVARAVKRDGAPPGLEVGPANGKLAPIKTGEGAGLGGLPIP